jgi:serine/threonine-protein kinase
MSDLILGQTLAEKYRIEEAIGASGLGKVYRGNHLLMDKTVIVKILSPALAIDDSIVRRFSEEARTVSHISHPNVLNVTDFGSDKDVVYIIFESVEGETLKEAIAREGKFPPEQAVNIARQIAAALIAAHKKGFVHGHLKSENILLAKADDESELVKVLEFGLNKDHDEASLKDLEYLAPEQNSSVSEADERSDIYSLGVIFYEMLAGEVPFTAENPTELMLKHAEEPPPPLSAFRSDLPAGVEPIVLKALAKNPEMRYQTANEFADDLVAISYSKAAAAPGNIWKTFSIVLVGIFVLSALLIYALSSKQRNPETMQTDAGSQPVQPINPATGINEQGLSNMMQLSPELFSNSNMNIPPGTLPGGDGFNPWDRPGAFQQVPQGGQVITIDPNNPSQFMPPDGSVILVPATPTPTPKPSPGETKTPANTQATPATTDTPATTKPTPKTDKTPVKPKPVKTNSQSDKKQDT